MNGDCSAACSSGGIMLKRSGRLGHATQVGGALWAEQRGSRSVAVSLSGCGEFIAKTCLAQKIAQGLLEWYDIALLSVSATFQQDSFKSFCTLFLQRIFCVYFVSAYLQRIKFSDELTAYDNSQV